MDVIDRFSAHARPLFADAEYLCALHAAAVASPVRFGALRMDGLGCGCGTASDWAGAFPFRSGIPLAIGRRLLLESSASRLRSTRGCIGAVR